MIGHPAIGLIEVGSLARGMVVTDQVVKKAEVTLVHSHPISPGRYLTLFTGNVAETEESFEQGIATAGEQLVDSMILTGVHDDLSEVLHGNAKKVEVDSLGIMETWSLASAIQSADRAMKTTDVDLLELRLASGISGKGYWVVSGKLFEVEEAIASARDLLAPGQLVNTEIIARPHEDMYKFIWS